MIGFGNFLNRYYERKYIPPHIYLQFRKDSFCCYGRSYRLGENVRQGRAVNGGDDQHFRALGDHVLDLRQLVRNVVLAILKVGRVAERGEFFHHALAIGNPADRRFGRHGNADKALVLGIGQSAEAEHADSGGCAKK